VTGVTSPAGLALDERVDTVDISLIVPTRNEAGNVEPLVDAVHASLGPSERTWEMIFVDDSDDETPERIRQMSDAAPEVRLIHRAPGRRRGGLASAVTEGFSQARGRAVVVMDGDLQHPPEMARRIAAPVLSGESDLVVASRYVSGASAAGLSGFWRRLVSNTCTFLVHLLVPASRGVEDPLSGFFALPGRTAGAARLKPHGFKILLEVLARTAPTRVMEVPFSMGERGAGTSKAGLGEGARFARHMARLVRPGPRTLGRLLLRLAAQVPLAGILAVQYLLSARLVHRNTAFVDEATYLSAGHYEIWSWSHPHAADMHLPTFFSGAPTIYPIIAAWADSIGGLAGARYLSMAFMFIATLAVYASARHLWGRPAGWLAAGLWVTTQGVQYLGSFATYDAMALMLITVAAWIVVRFAGPGRVSNLIYLSAPVMVLADATKYASALYNLVVVALAVFVVAFHHGWRSGVRVAATLAAFLVMGVAVALAVAPSSYLAGISSTTLNRAASTATRAKVLHTSWSWIGVIAVAAGVALAAVAVKGLATRGTGKWTGRRWAVVGIVAVGAAAVWLAPLNQARIHTETSLSKHVTFGAWFAALAAGWLATLIWRPDRPNQWWRVPALAVALSAVAVALVPAGVAGVHQANRLDDEWSNSNVVINALRPLVAGQNLPILMDQSEIPAYYLENEVELPQWVNTFYYAYTDQATGQRLVGPPAYAKAVEDGTFSVIALDFGTQMTVDHAVAAAVHDSGRYKWVGNFTSRDEFGPDTYVIWRRIR
jgi:glycosyltransferase involved in cell wall biosynthesis